MVEISTRFNEYSVFIKDNKVIMTDLSEVESEYITLTYEEALAICKHILKELGETND